MMRSNWSTPCSHLAAPLPIVPDNNYRKGLVPGTIRISNLFMGTAAKQPAVAVDTLVTTWDGAELLVSVIMLAEGGSRILADQV